MNNLGFNPEAERTARAIAAVKTEQYDANPLPHATFSRFIYDGSKACDKKAFRAIDWRTGDPINRSKLKGMYRAMVEIESGRIIPATCAYVKSGDALLKFAHADNGTTYRLA